MATSIARFPEPRPIAMKILLLVLGLACAGLLAYSFIDTDGPRPNGPNGPNAAASGASANGPERADLAAGGTAGGALRREVAENTEDWQDGLPVATARSAALQVTGRVVDSLGNGIADAEVALLHRQDFLNGGRGAAFDFAGMDFGDPNAMRQMRDRFRPQPAGSSTRTRADGTFKLQGVTFDAATLWITAQHNQLAPTAVERDWAVADGDVNVGDVVLTPGAMLIGTVLDDAGAPVAAATVEYAADQGRGRGQGGGRGGRGGRGGFGGMGADPVAELIGDAKTDASGSFQLGPVPLGSLRLTADAERHLEARSDAIELDENTAPPVIQLTLRRAGQLRGIVRDTNGDPIADARVTASEYIEPDPENNGRGGGRGRGGRGGFGRGGNDSTQTDAEGRFELTKVVPGPNTLRVNHGAYMDYESEAPISTGPEAFAEVTLELAPFLLGVVVDARTGEEITNFGIRARRDRGANGGGGAFGRGGGRGGRGQAEPDPAEAAARDAAQRVRTQQLAMLLGPSGRSPQRTPPPVDQGTGQFRLEGLDPGSFVVDVDAPGYVRTAFGPFELTENEDHPALTLSMDRGTTVIGQVLDNRNAPVAGAVVTLDLPPDPSQSNDTNPFAQAFGGGRGGRGGRGGGGGGLVRERTDADGWFELPALRPGTYRLAVEADGLQKHEQDDFLVVDRAEQQAVVRLYRGATVSGQVLAADLDGMRVEFRHVDGERYTARVDPEDGSYELQGLQPGGYFVAAMGRDGDSRRAAMAQLMTQDATAVPDLMLADGAEIRHDLLAISDELGKLEGIVTLNGQYAEGVSIRLRKIAAEGAAQDAAPMARFADRMLTAQVSDDGSYSLVGIPPASYTFEVLVSENARGGNGGRGNRGGGGGRVVHSEPIQIAAQVTSRVNANAQTASVEFTIGLPPGSEAARPRILLVPTAAVGDTAPDEWRRIEGATTLTVRDGSTGSVALAPGDWSYVLQGRGVASEAGQVSVGMGAPATINIQATAVPIEEDARAPRGGNAPGAAPAQGGRGAGGQGAGGRGQGGRGQGAGGRGAGQGGGRRGG